MTSDRLLSQEYLETWVLKCIGNARVDGNCEMISSLTNNRGSIWWSWWWWWYQADFASSIPPTFDKPIWYARSTQIWMPHPSFHIDLFQTFWSIDSHLHFYRIFHLQMCEQFFWHEILYTYVVILKNGNKSIFLETWLERGRKSSVPWKDFEISIA